MSWFSQKSKLKNSFTTQDEQLQNQKPIEQIESQLLLNIENIEKFYNLNSERKLIEIILDEKESLKVFEPKHQSSLMSYLHLSDDRQQKRIKFFAQKYSYEQLVQKFPKPKSATNELLLRILEQKLKTSTIASHQTRKNIWMLASGAKFNMINNKDLYTNLLRVTDYPKYFERSIIQDLHRTVNKTTSFNVDQDIKKLKNVLLAFSRRNPFIGYCQGLNFIAFFLLTMQFTEEQAFFLLTTMLESIIPMDYYTNMIGVVCDQQIFINILKMLKPKIVKKFEEVGLDPNVLSIEWFVCLFTSSLPFYLVKVVWDRLLVQGTKAFIKTGLIILTYFEDAIMQTSQFHEIIMILQKGTKNLQVSETLFNAEFEKYYINKRGLKIARNLYRQYHLKQKLSQKVVVRKKLNDIRCNPKWPICVVKLQLLRRDRQQIDVWVYRAQNSPKIIHDYLSNKSSSFEKKFNVNRSFATTGTQKSHPNSPQNVIKRSFKKSINEETINLQQSTSKGTTNDEQEINYQSPLKKTINQDESTEQDQKVDQKKENKKSKLMSFSTADIPIPEHIQCLKSNDLIIGRMDHICSKQYIQMEKVKFKKRSENKFLSMIFDDLNDNKQEEKRCQTYKKIKKASQILQEQIDPLKPIEKQNTQQNTPKVQQIQPKCTALERQQRALLAKSRTINFYNEFLENNKELSSIICGVQSFKERKAQDNMVVEEEQQEINQELGNSEQCENVAAEIHQ